MLFLAFDSSTDHPFLVITNLTQILYQAPFEKGLTASESLVEKSSEALRSLNIKPEQITAIIVGVGPGSYTGMRVSLMMAKTWNFALKTPLVPLYSLWAFKSFLEEKREVVSPCFDARIAGFYSCKRGFSKGFLEEEQELPREVSLEDFPLFSEGVDRFLVLKGKNPLEKLGKKNIFQEKTEEVEPDPLFFALQGIKEFLEKGGKTHREVEAIYLRKTEAERTITSS